MQLISEGVYFVNLNQSFSNSHLHWKLKNFVSNKVIKEKNEQSNSNSNQTIVTTTKSSISSSYIDFNDFPQIENETLFSQNHQKTFISEKDDKETSKTKNFQETNQTDKLIQNGKNLKKRKRKTNFTEEVQKSYETNQFPILKNALSSLDRIRDQILPILTLSDSQIEENDSKNMFLDFDVWHSTFDSMKRFQNQDIERETLPISNLIDFKQTIGQDMFDCKKIEPLEIFGKTIVNDLENKELILLVQPSLSSNEKQSAFIIPPESSFDLCSIQDYFNNGSQNQFDVILMDPPWPNRSVARGKKYKTESNYETLLLEEMKIQSILKTDAIVFVWITNKQSIKDFVIDNAFKKWGIEFECEILWLKVNSDLKPIFSVKNNNNEKKN